MAVVKELRAGNYRFTVENRPGWADHTVFCQQDSCKDTNWGGHGRLHLAGSYCPGYDLITEDDKRGFEMNSTLHPFVVGDWVRRKRDPKYVGKVTEVHGDTQVSVKWDNGEIGSSMHYTHLELTNNSVLNTMERKRFELTEEIEALEKKRADLDTAIEIVKGL